jgi:hypothetical protein
LLINKTNQRLTDSLPKSFNTKTNQQRSGERKGPRSLVPPMAGCLALLEVAGSLKIRSPEADSNSRSLRLPQTPYSTTFVGIQSCRRLTAVLGSVTMGKNNKAFAFAVPFFKGAS